MVTGNLRERVGHIEKRIDRRDTNSLSKQGRVDPPPEEGPPGA